MVRARVTLREARLRAGLTQEEVAEHMGVDLSMVSKWDNFIAVPRMPNAVKLVKLYGVTLDDIAWNVDE